MLSRHLRIKKYFHFSLSAFLFFLIFFSRNDVSRKRFREAEGEASPQSPSAGAFLLKKRRKISNSQFRFPRRNGEVETATQEMLGTLQVALKEDSLEGEGVVRACNRLVKDVAETEAQLEDLRREQESLLILLFFVRISNIWQLLEGSFSAVSKPIFAKK